MRGEISSKAQVGVVSVGLFLASLFLTAYSARNPAVARVGNELVMELVAPISSVTKSARDGVVGVLDRYLRVVRASRENEELRSRVGELERKLGLLAEVERENLRLSSLLNFTAERDIRGTVATVVGGDPSGWIKGIIVNKGERDGITPGAAVVSARGVVGQVVSVSSDASRVLLVSDHSSGVDFLIQGSRARGVAEGAGDQGCELKFVTKDQSAKVGDVVVTSGLDQVYPKGLVLGTVSHVGASGSTLLQTIAVKPAVDFSRLEEVLIVNRGGLKPIAPLVAGGS